MNQVLARLHNQFRDPRVEHLQLTIFSAQPRPALCDCFITERNAFLGAVQGCPQYASLEIHI